MLTKRFTINCSEITTLINEIKTKKVEFDGVEKTDIPKALSLKKELQISIKQLKEILKPVFKIEGKEFPVFQLEIGGKKAEELESELLSKNIKITEFAHDLLHSDITFLPTVENIDLVRLRVSDLGFTGGAITEKIYTKAFELGLELCPPEVGPYQRLKDEHQNINGFYLIAMKQINGLSGNPGIFGLDCRSDGLRLGGSRAGFAGWWNPSFVFIFRIPNK